MKIQDIEKAVLKQLPSKGDHLICKDNFLSRPGAKKDRHLDIGMVILCGLSSIYLPDAQGKIVAHYDIDNKGYRTNLGVFEKHLNRVSEIINEYGGSDYKSFSEAFWIKHNSRAEGERLKSGVILSHILSSKREFSNFIKWNPVFQHEDYLSFFIYNKAQLAKNFLSLHFPLSRREYVDHLLSF